MQNYKPGEIVENSTGPMVVQSVQSFGEHGTMATLSLVEGPRTLYQQERENWHAKQRDQDSRDLAEFEALSEVERQVYNTILAGDFVENGALLAEIRRVTKEVVRIVKGEQS